MTQNTLIVKTNSDELLWFIKQLKWVHTAAQNVGERLCTTV